MQNQKRAEAESLSFGSVQSEEELKIKPLQIEVPDVHETMKLAGVKDLKLDQTKSRNGIKRW
jgi:hypothetical protein